MKALLIFAVFAFAANAYLATPAYHLGFSEQLGLNSQQLQTASTCFNSFKQVMIDIHTVVESKNQGLSAILRSLLTTVENIQHKLQVDCGNYIQELARVVLRNTNGDIKGTLMRNFDLYTAEIIQQVALYFDALKSGNAYQAGHIDAYVIQILFGLEKPKTYAAPQFNSSRYVPINFTKYAMEFSEGYFKTLGLYDEKGIQDNAQCIISNANFINALQGLSHGLPYAASTEEKIQIIENLVRAGVNFFDACLPAFEFSWDRISMPIIKAFQKAPVHSIVTLIHNIAVNFPELKQNHIEAIFKIYEGEYFQAGKMNADALIALVRGFFF